MRIALKIIGGIFACAGSFLAACFFAEKTSNHIAEGCDTVYSKFAKKEKEETATPESTPEAE